MKINNIKHQYILIILSFIFLSLISDIILFHTNRIYNAYDFQFHIKRIMELRDSLLHNNLSPLFSTNYFHGSAVMSMYPYTNLYPIVLLSFITNSFINVYYLSFIFSIFISLIISFFSSLKFSKSLPISYLFSVTYSMSTVFIMNNFATGDLGIVSSMVFLPLVIFGFIDLLKGSHNYIKLAIGISLMLMSQLASVTIVVVFLCLWLILNINELNKNIFFRFIKSALLTCLLTSIMWIPIMHIFLNNHINGVRINGFNSVNLITLLKYMSFTSLLMVPIGIFCFKRFNAILKQMYIFSLLITIFFSSLLPWKEFINFGIFKLFKQFQFGFRFLIIPQILLCYLFAYFVITYLCSNKNYRLIFVLILTSIVSLQLFGQISFIYHKENGVNHIYITNISKVKYANDNKIMKRVIITDNSGVKYMAKGYIHSSDYYPITSTNEMNVINNNKGIESNKKIINIRNYKYNKFAFRNNSPINKLTLPLIQYNGEDLHLYLDGRPIKHYINNNRLIIIKNITCGKHYLNIKYIPNNRLIICRDVLFILGVLWVLLLPFKSKLLKYRKK